MTSLKWIVERDHITISKHETRDGSLEIVLPIVGDVFDIPRSR